MSLHSFDPVIAEKVGANAAVVYQNIVFWAEHNMNNRNKKHGREYWHDGYWWTFNSRSAFSEQFSYLTADQIRTALDKLVSVGLLKKGNYNKAGFDKTNWYAPAISTEWPVGEKTPTDGGSDPNPLGKKPQPIPDSKPDTKTDNKNARGRADDLFSANDEADEKPKADEDLSQGFEEIWKAFPRKPNMPGKDVCKREYKRVLKKVSHAELMRAVRAYAKSRENEDPKFHSRLSKWLRDGNYEGFLTGPEYRWDDLRPAQQTALADGRCPPSMLENGEPNAVAAHWLAKMRRAS
ncbi:conserved hypothetical protein [Ruegeria sp. TrichCH4B]|nr:conserved hypothetical protein [Ruegeria sp. TrichCH4B]